MLKKINWRYALGEIVIVIIGITIAFALNNWASNSKERKVRQQYLQSLEADLLAEKDHLSENITAFQSKIDDVKVILPCLYGRQEGRDTIAPKVFSLAELVNFKPNDLTYKTLINSGDLTLFDDLEFRKALESHYAGHEQIILDYQRQQKIHEKYFGDFMIYNMDYSKYGQGDYSFLDDKLLRNIVQSLYGTFHIGISSSQQGIDNCEEMISMLSKASR